MFIISEDLTNERKRYTDKKKERKKRRYDVEGGLETTRYSASLLTEAQMSYSARNK